MRKKLWIILGSVALACCLALTTVLIVCCKGGDSSDERLETAYSTGARYGYGCELLGTTARNIPKTTSDGGLSYPVYGTTKSLTTEEKTALNEEAASLCGGAYDKMDGEGNLFRTDGTPVNSGANHGKLYKHSASVGHYFGNVSDSEPAVIKRITFLPRTHSTSYNVTGLYAPAGEVVKIEMSEEDMLATGGIVVHIGQALYNGQANNIWTAKNYNRMPVILNTMTFNAANATYNASAHTYTCTVGSYLGGPIYVRATAKRVSITVSGAVEYRHFILGMTTEAEYTRLSQSTAPYFDLEVWDNGVLHSGPVSEVADMSYAEIFKAAVLWDKISALSTQVKKQGIVFLYDPFVAAGAAVAFPGRCSVNCPTGWMKGSLNYDGFIANGSWGNIHEYNHNFQGWGLPGGGEVTNNALNLAAYAQFTEISSARRLTAAGESGLSGWNAYTIASRVLNQVLAKDYAGTNQLSIYATLLHNVGAESFVKSAKGNGVTAYYNSLCDVTGYDMTYFFRELIGEEPDGAAVSAVKAKNLPVFVPVSSVYQTGRSVGSGSGKKYITTMRPYEIEYGKPFELDLSRYQKRADGAYAGGSVVLPEGFSYRIKNVSKPENGKLEIKGNDRYLYTPSDQTSSGRIVVTLSITRDDGAFSVDDVDLVIELSQSHELKRGVLERTVYTYADNDAYASAQAAYEADYAGYTEKREEENVNPVQNGNAEIWVPDPAANAFMEIRGKLYVAEEGDYRIALRGRKSCALYISRDGKNYRYAAGFSGSDSSPNFRGDADSYCDLTGLHAGSWVYFKAVLKVDYASAFIGVGWGKFEVNGTMDENGNFVDENGNPIDEAAARTVKINYANGYRSNYEFKKDDFDPDYLFTKTVTVSFDNSVGYSEKGSLVSASGYMPWDGSDTYKLGNLFDADETNVIHSAKSKNGEYDITPENPFDITVDLGKEITASAMTIYGVAGRADYLPKNYTLYVGKSTGELHKVMEVTGAVRTGAEITADFPAETFRYYRFVCTDTYLSEKPAGAKYISYREIKFGSPFTLTGGTAVAPEAAAYGGSWRVEYALSTFGRVYYGQKGAAAEFTFTGKRFAVLSANAVQYGKFDVYIDGKLASSAYAGQAPEEKGLAFLSEILSEGAHTVKLVCKAEANIETFLCW